jgi:dGTPase
MNGYDEHDAERWVAEPAKRPGRTAFARDRARVLHSAMLRRLAAKTQVVGPDTDDFVRNRLTHSLEVAQIGRELGNALGCDPDIVDAACLAHDLGHPPFGHNGERALDEAAVHIGGFEGNAQTLRLLTRLEAKTFAPDGLMNGRSVGLNLTRATLDAATKYPWRRREGERKFGVYDDDTAVFGWYREPEAGDHRCLEAQVMDFADDVAYSVHDVEDGIVAHSVDLAEVGADRQPYWHSVRRLYLPEATDDELDEAWGRLGVVSYWPARPFDDSRRALAGLKDLTSQLIGRFCAAAELATRAAYGRVPLTRYAAELVVPERTRAEIAVLKAIGVFHVMNSPARQHRRAEQRDLLAELVAALWKSAPAGLDPAFAADFAAAADDEARFRVVIDQVASLTDASAVAWHARV